LLQNCSIDAKIWLFQAVQNHFCVLGISLELDVDIVLLLLFTLVQYGIWKSCVIWAQLTKFGLWYSFVHC